MEWHMIGKNDYVTIFYASLGLVLSMCDVMLWLVTGTISGVSTKDFGRNPTETRGTTNHVCDTC
jgi:hypothetical protein